MDKRYLEQMVGNQKYADLEPFCLACGYDLRGSPSGRCPECGTTFSRKEWSREIDRVLARMHDVDDSLSFVPYSWRLAAVAVAARLLAALQGDDSWGPFLLNFTAFMMGIAAVGTGLSMVRIRQVPAWARAKMRNRPDPALAAIGAAGGALVILSTILFG